jgi:predicted ArsR family transcriptional regulator
MEIGEEGTKAMQATRQRIVELLRERGEATVEELAGAVGLTQMAIRHHLNVLQSENLVITSKVRRHNAPGRPQQLYSLTEAADGLRLEDYYRLTSHLLDALTDSMGSQTTMKLLRRIAARMAAEAPALEEGQSFADQLEQVTGFLTRNGFVCRWEKLNGSYAIHTLVCPYRQIARANSDICELDMALISHLLNMQPRRTACIAQGDEYCTYILGSYQPSSPSQGFAPRMTGEP